MAFSLRWCALALAGVWIAVGFLLWDIHRVCQPFGC